ncbi:probable trehalose-phosphate phosphatase 6 [Phalaenopsis equestris]|uniref:probable trehalose-phosphate phosphatase 6 n=1 Tax=Phalaenopsis equestris TaxID=78828 RepID=UPI0009E3F932|nr:probable trehalose-phosphate phosphatase 6 [Phalaenopsis equestris]
MTKLSTVVPEEMLVPVPVLPPETVSSTQQPGSFPPPRCHSNANYKNLLTNLELHGNGGKTSSWMETIKASSPTHAKSVPFLPNSQSERDENDWNRKHPSALSRFDDITAAAKGKKIVMFLDYDGTLSPIVEDPDSAFMSESMRAAVKSLAKCFPTAIVSGRCRDKVFGFVQLAELYYAGSHGMDIKGPAKWPKHTNAQAKAVLCQPASAFLPVINEAYNVLSEKIKLVPGAKLENNRFCLSVHFRCVEEKRWNGLAEEVRSVLTAYPNLKLTQGRKVLEIRPTIEWDKGKALEYLLEELGFADCNDILPVYIGDDRTDEDAFKVLRDRGQGFGILVSKFPKETCATYTLKEPSEVKEFLRRLVEWRRNSLKAEHRVGVNRN